VPPVWNANVSDGLELISVGAAATVRVTLTVIGPLLAPVELICTVPLYVPAAREFARIETLTVPGVVPLGVAASQLPPVVVLTDVVNGIAAPPEAVTDRFCAPGSEPRFAMLKDSGPPVTDNVGLLVTTKLTGIVTGLLVAPLEVRVIEPLYVPAARPVMAAPFTEAVTPVGVVALPGETVSQAPPVVVAAAAV
jgi:hypothetical protein